MSTKVSDHGSGPGPRRRLLLICLVAGMVGSLALVGAVVVLLPLAARANAKPASVRVDAQAELGELNNPVWYQNQVRVLPEGDLALAEAAGPTKVIRVWLKPLTYYQQSTNTYDFTSFYPQLDNAASHTQALMANMDQCPQDLMTLDNPEPCRQILKAGIKHFKQKYPKLRYIELFNEPDKNWAGAPGDPPALPVEVYYRWFKIAYEVVNEVNAELRPKQPLQLGGPVSYRLNDTYIPAFLDQYAKDQNPGKHLDFIAYHEYTKRSNPAEVAKAKTTVSGWLRDRQLDPNIPVCVTEYGVFPGSASSAPGRGTTYEKDLLTQAAAMAVLGNFYVRGGTDMPMHWIYNHSTNERKSMFVDDADGTPQPYYNLIRMQSMLKQIRINSTSTGMTTAGIGVSSLATRDSSGMAILLTNYQWTNGHDTRQVQLDIPQLPAELAGRQIEVRRYLIDEVTSNYAHDHNDAELRQVEQTQLEARDSLGTKFKLTPNAITLVVVTPVEP